MIVQRFEMIIKISNAKTNNHIFSALLISPIWPLSCGNIIGRYLTHYFSSVTSLLALFFLTILKLFMISIVKALLFTFD